MQILDGLQHGLLLLFHSLPSPRNPFCNKTHSGKASSLLPEILAGHPTSFISHYKIPNPPVIKILLIINEHFHNI